MKGAGGTLAGASKGNVGPGDRTLAALEHSCSLPALGREDIAGPEPRRPRQRRLRNPRRQLAFAAGHDFQPMPPHACPEKMHAPAPQLPSHGHLLMDVSPQTPAGDQERPRNL